MGWLKRAIRRWLEIETIPASRITGQLTSAQLAAGSVNDSHLSQSLFRPGGQLAPEVPSSTLRWVERTPEGVTIHDTDPREQR